MAAGSELQTACFLLSQESIAYLDKKKIKKKSCCFAELQAVCTYASFTERFPIKTNFNKNRPRETNCIFSKIPVAPLAKMYDAVVLQSRQRRGCDLHSNIS